MIGEVLWNNPLHSPLSRIGSVHSSRDGSRMLSVLHDLRRTRNAITISKTACSSTRPRTSWSQGHCFLPTTAPWDRKQLERHPLVLKILGLRFKVQPCPLLSFFFGKKECGRMCHLSLLPYPKFSQQVLGLSSWNLCGVFWPPPLFQCYSLGHSNCLSLSLFWFFVNSISTPAKRTNHLLWLTC